MNRRDMIIIAVLSGIVVLAGLGGYFIGHNGSQSAVSSATPAARKPLYWVSSMDPSYRRDKPGKDSMGMDLVPIFASASGGTTPSDVTISPNVVDNIGVRTATVEHGSLSRRIETVGYVGYDEDTLETIDTRAEGWVEILDVKSVGDAVRRGQRLYELFSPKLATAEREYLTALASGMSDLTSVARERLTALGFSAGQIRELARTRKASDRVARYADNNGVVVSLGVQQGAFVTPATQVMQLADLSTVWVLVEIPQADTARLKIGQKAVAQFDAFPGRQWQGEVDYVYPDVNAATRTAKVRLRFDNRDGSLQPNMYAQVSIFASPDDDTVTIPSSALIRTGQSERVAVALGDGRFDICPVEAGFESGGMVQILKGLVPGEKVVVSSQFLIDSEANVDAAALRLGADRARCEEAAKAQSGMAPPATSGSAMKTPDGSVMIMPDGSTMKMPAAKDHAQ